jgi:5-formyltetrahydrofolate cyclo-ligase
MSKFSLRKQLKSDRLGLSSSEIDDASLQAATHLLKTDLYQSSQSIALYLAFKNEIHCSKLIEQCFLDNKSCYLPVIKSNEEAFFVHYQENQKLIKSEFGIFEPEHSEDDVTDIEEIDLIITPLVGFDSRGHRLGMGAGFYDRVFQNKKHPFLCGLAYSSQEVEEVPVDDWDVNLDGVATEKEFKIFT